MKKFIWLGSLCIVLLSGCTVWSRVEQSSFNALDHSYSVDLPVGWVRLLAGRADNQLSITNDGFGIAHIEIEKHENKNAFVKIKKSANENMLAFELAELTLAELKSADTATTLNVIENSPAMLAGRPGFKLELRAKNSKGVEFETLIYGVCSKTGFYTLRYEATRVHYFDHYAPVFDKLVASFKLL